MRQPVARWDIRTPADIYVLGGQIKIIYDYCLRCVSVAEHRVCLIRWLISAVIQFG